MVQDDPAMSMAFPRRAQTHCPLQARIGRWYSCTWINLMASRAHIGWTWTWAERASWFGKSGVGAINWQGSFGTLSAGYSKRGSRENIVCAGENS